ncbi:xanthine dehydrogenase accessory protein XdhC [Breoghania sp. L-A4]|uniref:xanthine dehydrogenase accessory protein XdhC n=1 Tax=Breoghania sp. L-A4 TaxID=2304600 RepID=UPI0020BE3F25|nr:xanthine dehydrogenase accessory protein XdhC [Breoghania sp. L-A4]
MAGAGAGAEAVRRAARVRHPRACVGPDLGQCCGGRVTLAFEMFSADRLHAVRALAALEAEGDFVTRARVSGAAPLERSVIDDAELHGAAARFENGVLLERFGAARTPLYLFGAGHVARALVLALAPLPFSVTWVDPRAEAFPYHVPGNVVCRHEADPASVLAEAQDGAFVLVMTHSHTLDQEIVHAALDAGRFDYVGLIGSATKRARFLSRMRQAGLCEEALGALVCPIGVKGIAGKEPAVLAAATVAELLVRREAAAAMAGVEAPGDVEAPLVRLADAN